MSSNNRDIRESSRIKGINIEIRIKGLSLGHIKDQINNIPELVMQSLIQTSIKSRDNVIRLCIWYEIHALI